MQWDEALHAHGEAPIDSAITNRLLERSRDLWNATSLEERIARTARKDVPFVNDLENYPHAFVIGCVMNRGIPAEKAWRIPGEIHERLGTLELERLSRLDADEAERLFSEPPALHRYRKKMAECFRDAVHRIRDEYGGDASNIWAAPVGSAELVRRFRKFRGVGQKISTMAANILVRDFRIDVTDRRHIDISVDVHVQRVFGRLELIPQGADELDIVVAARTMHPEYPGIFDFACWDIGRKWCKATDPVCGECYMEDLCPTAGRM